MRYLLGLLALLVMSPVWAKPSESALSLYFYNPEMRYERSSTQEIVDRKPLNLAFSYRYQESSFLLEFSRFEDLTGNQTSSIERRHQDLSLWFRYHMLNAQSRQLKFSLFGGAGVGAYEEVVVTTLSGMSRTDKTSPKLMSGLMVGGDCALSLSPNWDFHSSLEGRALLASDFDPKPVWSGLIRFGFGFKF